MGNPVNLTTLRNNKRIFYIVGFVFGALIAFVMGLAGIGIAATADSSKETSKIIGGAVMACAGIGGGIYLSFLAYNETTDRRNEIKCVGDNFNVYTDIQIPSKYVAPDSEYDIELDVPEFDTGRKVQTKGYGGVFLKSNNATESIGGNWDAIFIPGDARAVTVKPNYTTKSAKDYADRLYVNKKYNNKVIVKDVENKSPISPYNPSFDVCKDPYVEA